MSEFNNNLKNPDSNIDENIKKETFNITTLDVHSDITDFCKGVEYLEEEFMENILKEVEFPITILTENSYVDKVHRDSYYIYLSSKHFNYERNCKRLCIFRGKYNIDDLINLDNQIDECNKKYKELRENLIGITVVRPSSVPDFHRTVGRTLLDPQKLNLGNYKLCTTDFKVNILGKKYEINAFPFMSQDSEVMKCAETTVWGIMEYFGTSDSSFKTILPSDIVRIMDEISRERNLPSNGLTYAQVTNLFKVFGFEPKIYNEKTYNIGEESDNKNNSVSDNNAEVSSENSFDRGKNSLTDTDYNDIILSTIDLRRIVHYYSLSAIPFAMGLQENEKDKNKTEKDGHSVICIGCGNPKYDLDKANVISTDFLQFVDSADFYNSYVIIDDNQYPYRVEKYDCFSNNRMKVDIISVPLYKHIFLDAPSAAGIVYNFLIQYSEDIRAIFNEYKEIESLLDSEPLVTNIFLTNSSSFQSYRVNNTSVYQEKILYLEKRYPKYIWVCELSPFSLHKNRMVVGEIILDATSDVNDFIESIISVRFGKYEAYHSAMNEDWFSELDTNDDWNYKFPAFQGNLREIKRREAST